ncbi:MAG: hypothetical protein K1Y36_25715 [Blastocatellia bacterium]|nr:hypothetical protein [Blastocatellia bacterium]
MKRRIYSSTIRYWFGLWALLLPVCLGHVTVAQATLPAPASPATSEKPVPVPANPLQVPGRFPLHLYTEAQGLPQNTIEAVAFDQQGYLWAGSQNGIARFNGHLWQRIPLEGTQSGSWIHDILSASDGSLWFARQGGISCLRTEGWKHFDQQTGFPDISAWRLLESVKPDGTPVVWCGTFKTGLFRIEHDQMTQVDIPSPLPRLKTIQCLFETRDSDSSRKLWVGTELGALSYDGQNWKLYTMADGLPNQAVRAVFETSLFSGKPELVACCGPYLARFDGARWHHLTDVPPLPTPSVSMAIETRAANGSPSLWFGMHGNGLLRLQSGLDGFVWTRLTEATGFPNDQVWCVRAMAGKEGTRSLWAGTSGGLVRLDPYQWQTIDSRTGLSHNNVWCIQPAPAATGVPALWVGTLKGLTCFSANRETGLPTVQVYDTRSGLPNDQVWCLLETTALTGQKTLVAGTGQGLARLENGRWIPAPLPIQGKFQPVIWSLNETKADDGSPVLWVGTSLSGVWRWSLNHWEHFSKSSGNFPSDWIYDIVETTDRQGNHTVWFATFEGLVQWQNGTSRLYDLKAGLPSSSLWGLHVSQTQNGTFLWVAGNQGVGRANLAETPLTWTVFSTKTKPALPDNDVYRIAEDLQGRLYLTTNHGIARLTPRLPTAENPAPYHINTFTTEDGLPYNECNQGALTIDEQGQVWAGTTKGLAHFSVAQEVTDNPPRLVLEQATAGMRHPIPVKAQTELSASQNLLHFTYALLQYSHGAETMYQTQLVGMEETPSEWSHDTKIRYTNLAAGSYSFCVWGRDASGNITGPTTLSFHVKPAWWRTWWAYGCYLVGVAGVGYGLVRVRVRRLERQNLLLESKVTERTSQLAEKNEQLDKKIAELARKNQELIESHKRAEFIFSALAEVLPGTVLDSKYRLDAKIGAGGFGAVFRATHLSLNRSVAVKVFRPASGNDSKEALERFRFEGVTACRKIPLRRLRLTSRGIFGREPKTALPAITVGSGSRSPSKVPPAEL